MSSKLTLTPILLLNQVHRAEHMYSVRKVMVTHVRLFHFIYKILEKFLMLLNPLWRLIGYERVNRGFAFFERNIKGFLFDCQMCGNCILDKTGLSCPMNCPKQMRNGPCGGVRFDGHCEVEPEMRCVWLEAWRGAKVLQPETSIIPEIIIQQPIDQRHNGRSSWLNKISDRQHQKSQIENQDGQ